MINKEQLLVDRMHRDDVTALDEVYRTYRDGFINYALRYELDYSDIEDVYQDCIIAVYQSFVIKKIVLKSSSLKTYIYGIGKNMIYTRFSKKVHTVDFVNDIMYNDYPAPQEELTLEQQLLAKHFNTISSSCQEILKLFYYRGLSVKEIVNATNYKDENTVKSHKSRCLKGLKQKIATNSLNE
ncbi:MAG: sigma-70 family RNA polymerase sigma factor [Nonlabens sp.]